jgi:hypothetical protein
MQPLLKSWIHSNEEDGNGVTVYRPDGFAFPPSRGRDGIEFRPDGVAMLSDSGRDDRGRSRLASWRILDDALIELSVPGSLRAGRMTIVECNDAILRVRWDPRP